MKEIKKEWHSYYLSQGKSAAFPIDTKTPVENIAYSYELFAKLLKHKARMWYQKFFKKHHVKIKNHSRKSFR